MSGTCALAAEASLQDERVEGFVLDQASAPVAGAQISLMIESLDERSAMTGSDGRFFFDAVPSGKWTLRVTAQGFGPYTLEREQGVTSATPLRIVLVPAPVREEVTVTATRAETRLDEAAASVVVLSSENLETSAALTLDDVLRQVPGFQLFRRSGSRTANPTSQGVSLRGVGASGASRALVLLDGVPLNDPFGGWVYWSRVPRASLSRVEILRGGASPLYGSSALGGVINLNTKRAARPILTLETSYGNQQTPTASLFAGGRRGNWGASLAAEIFNTDGYILVEERARGPIDVPAGSRHATFDFTLERLLSKEARAFARGSWFGESRRNGTPLQINRTGLRQLTFGLDWHAGLTGAWLLRAFTGTQTYDQTFSAVAPDRASETLTRVQRVPSQNTGLSLQWSRAFPLRQTIVAGLEAREVRGASDEIAFVVNRPSALVGAGGRERSFGLYIEDLIAVTDRLRLTATARIDRWRNYNALAVTRSLASVNGTTIVNAFPDRTETAFSPQASLHFKLNEHLFVHALANRAFRAPTLNELYRSFRVGDVLTLANENLRAERLAGAEGGASFYARRLRARTILFWSELTRPIANVTLSIAPALITRRRENLGRTRSRGVELDFDLRLSNRWRASGGYLFADARVVRFPANTSLEGLRIPQVARHQYSFQINYADNHRWTMALQGRGASAQFDDDQNLFALNPYFSLDALLARPITRGLEAFLAAENLLNRRYEVGRTPVVTLGPPLLVRFGLRLQLGETAR